MRIAWDNLLKTATLSATNEDANYPVENLYHKWARLKFEAGTTSTVITASFPEARDVSCVGWSYHNIQSASAVLKDSAGETLDTWNLPMGPVNPCPKFVDDGSGQDGDYVYDDTASDAISAGVQVFTPTAQFGKVQFEVDESDIWVAGHTYAFIAQVKSADANAGIALNGNATTVESNFITTVDTWETIGVKVASDVGDTSYFLAQIYSVATSSWSPIYTKNWMLLDLTDLDEELTSVADLIDEYYYAEDADGVMHTGVYYDTEIDNVASVELTLSGLDDIYLGSLFIGAYDQYDKSAGQDIPLSSTANVTKSIGGQVAGRIGITLRGGNITIPDLSVADRKQLEAMYDELQEVYPFWLDLWHSSHASFAPVYGHMTSGLRIEKDEWQNTTASFDFEEAR